MLIYIGYIGTYNRRTEQYLAKYKYNKNNAACVLQSSCSGHFQEKKKTNFVQHIKPLNNRFLQM